MQLGRLLFKWLNRRSEKRSFTYEQYREMLDKYAIPTPCIMEPPYQPKLL